MAEDPPSTPSGRALLERYFPGGVQALDGADRMRADIRRIEQDAARDARAPLERLIEAARDVAQTAPGNRGFIEKWQRLGNALPRPDPEHGGSPR